MDQRVDALGKQRGKGSMTGQLGGLFFAKLVVVKERFGVVFMHHKDDHGSPRKGGEWNRGWAQRSTSLHKRTID